MPRLHGGASSRLPEWRARAGFALAAEQGFLRPTRRFLRRARFLAVGCVTVGCVTVGLLSVGWFPRWRVRPLVDEPVGVVLNDVPV